MKRILSLITAAMLITLTACGVQTQNPAASTPPPDTSPVTQPSDLIQLPEQKEESPQAEHILIAYFSLWENASWGEYTDANTSASVVVDNLGAVGTNAYVAQMIQSKVGGDLHAIIAAEPYPADFDQVRDINHQENSRAISSTVENMEQYDTVFIGYPVWATTLPQAVRTFLTEYDFSGKTVIPFCTHDGYGAGRSFSTVAELAAGANTLEGLAIHAPEVTESKDDIKQWLGALDLDTERGQGETAIRITVGDTQLDGVLYDSDMARQFIAQLPQTISMSNYGDREVYGGIDQEITVEGEGQLRFEDGDITYCPSNNTAAIFYSQSDRPDLTMRIYPIGKVTSDLSIFPDLPSRVDITFEIME
ncbi:hypothetical protein D1646_07180 [Pseudoflavonifractor sp. 60]|uniref:flavodoxin n=1 Tax=Pseudoflavonifractor sp. 60 TaxID=2304576 RepID=UPI00136B1829|nr:cyclophilin-like fold protein [Pseudoflavonifractor sp. 60]MCI8913687.1 hypothetical protein [Lawsonibacter sp.]NBI66601.1 hypothetical protein [Pseudoflavonifractor sp. 60]